VHVHIGTRKRNVARLSHGLLEVLEDIVRDPLRLRSLPNQRPAERIARFVNSVLAERPFTCAKDLPGLVPAPPSTTTPRSSRSRSDATSGACSMSGSSGT